MPTNVPEEVVMSEPIQTPITVEEGLEIFHGLPAGDVARALYLMGWHVGVTYSGCSKPHIVESLITPGAGCNERRIFTREAASVVNEKARELMAAHKANTATKKGLKKAQDELAAELRTLVGPALRERLECWPSIAYREVKVRLLMTTENFWAALPSVWFAYCGEGEAVQPLIVPCNTKYVEVTLTRDQLVRFNLSVETEHAAALEAAIGGAQ
jgi:hypothetical protein